MSDYTGIISGMKYRVPPYGTVLRGRHSGDTVMIVCRESDSIFYSVAVALIAPGAEFYQAGDLLPPFAYKADEWDVVKD